MEKIKTNKGYYEYEPTALYYGRKIIDKNQAKENLLLFKKIMGKEGISFGLIYGTLLGAIREKDFISHDEDIDVFMLDEYREKFLALLFVFREKGFEVARYENDLLSLIRKDDYIDVYIFNKSLLGRKCNGDFLPSKFFIKFDNVEFCSDTFQTLNNPIEFLEYAYGKTWNIPQRNKPAEVKSFLTVLKILIRKILPDQVVSLLKRIIGKK